MSTLARLRAQGFDDFSFGLITTHSFYNAIGPRFDKIKLVAAGNHRRKNCPVGRIIPFFCCVGPVAKRVNAKIQKGRGRKRPDSSSNRTKVSSRSKIKFIFFVCFVAIVMFVSTGEVVTEKRKQSMHVYLSFEYLYFTLLPML